MLEKGFQISVLNDGYVRYIDHFGSDLRIVESARISYKSPSKGEEQDKRLLFYLYKNSHLSPFEQSSITFNIKLPIFCMRQIIRHRTAHVNEISGRYTELHNDFYIPSIWRQQDLKNKQGSIESDGFYPTIPVENSEYEITATEEVKRICQEIYKSYQKLLKSGISKEMARFILPLNIYTEIYLNFDIRNLMHFFKLRLDEHTQFETRLYAKAMFDIFEKLYPWCAEAYKKYKFEIKEQ